MTFFSAFRAVLLSVSGGFMARAWKREAELLAENLKDFLCIQSFLSSVAKNSQITALAWKTTFITQK